MPSTAVALHSGPSDATPSRTPPSKLVELTGLDGVWNALRVAAEDKRRANQLYEDLAGIVKARMGAAEIGTLNGEPVVSYTQTERIILRDKLVRVLHPDVARECEDIIPIRTFRLLD